jgi:hypothetical protein
MASDQLERSLAPPDRVERAPARRFVVPVATSDGAADTASVLIPHRRVPLLTLGAARTQTPGRDEGPPARAHSHAVADPSVYWG